MSKKVSFTTDIARCNGCKVTKIVKQRSNEEDSFV